MVDSIWIISSPDVLDGKPHVRGTRLSVDFLRELVEQGATPEEILVEHDQLTPEALRASLLHPRLT